MLMVKRVTFIQYVNGKTDNIVYSMLMVKRITFIQYVNGKTDNIYTVC